MFNYLGNQVEYIKIPLNPLRKIWKWLTFQPYQVVYLHGFCDPFQNHLDLLGKIAAKGYEVYAINLPGHMNSEKWKTVSWEHLTHMVHSFFYQKSIRNPIVVGFSLGGGIALKLSVLPHTKIHSLKLIAPFCYSLSTLSLETIQNVFESAVDTVQDMRLTHKPFPRAKANLPYVATHYMNLFSNFKLDVSDVCVPTTVLLLEKDHIFENEQIKETLSKIDACKFDTLNGQPHDIYYITEQQVDDMIAKLF